MVSFNPWLTMGTAQAAPAPAEPFPGRRFAGPPDLAASPGPSPQNPQWSPYMDAYVQPFVGPPSSAMPLPSAPDDLAAAQASIEQQALEQSPMGGAVVPRGTQTTQEVKTMAKTAGSPGIQELIANLNKRELASLGQQGLSVEKLRQALGGLQGQEIPADLTPLAALTDTWTGSHFADSYKPVETLKDRRAAVERLQGQIQQGEQGLSQDEIALLKSQLGSQFQLENLGYQKEQDAIKNDLERQKLAIDRDKLTKTNPLDPMAAFKIRTDLEKLDTTKAIKGNIELANALNNYEKVIDKYGATPTGTGAAALDNAYSAITLAYKNAGELGALSGPDMKIVEQGVRNTGDLGGWLKTGLKGGTAGVKTQIAQMRSATKAGFDRRMEGVNSLIQGYEPLAGDYVKNYQTQMSQAMGTHDLQGKSRQEKEAELAQLQAAQAARKGP